MRPPPEENEEAGQENRARGMFGDKIVHFRTRSTGPRRATHLMISLGESGLLATWVQLFSFLPPPAPPPAGAMQLPMVWPGKLANLSPTPWPRANHSTIETVQKFPLLGFRISIVFQLALKLGVHLVS